MLSVVKHPQETVRYRATLGFSMKSFGYISAPRRAGILHSLWSFRMTPLKSFIAQTSGI
jgi:hypothetical protein